MTSGEEIIRSWFDSKGQRPFAFQTQAWKQYLAGRSGLLNAPTAFGKTFALFLPVLIEFINQHPDWQKKEKNGLQLLWVTPLRALGKDIQRAMHAVCSEIGLPWQVGLRNGDTPQSERQKQKRQPPEILIITPESLHLLLAQKKSSKYFEKLQAIVVDEWHELLGGKRGVL